MSLSQTSDVFKPSETGTDMGDLQQQLEMNDNIIEQISSEIALNTHNRQAALDGGAPMSLSPHDSDQSSPSPMATQSLMSILSTSVNVIKKSLKVRPSSATGNAATDLSDSPLVSGSHDPMVVGETYTYTRRSPKPTISSSIESLDSINGGDKTAQTKTASDANLMKILRSHKPTNRTMSAGQPCKQLRKIAKDCTSISFEKCTRSPTPSDSLTKQPSGHQDQDNLNDEVDIDIFFKEFKKQNQAKTSPLKEAHPPAKCTTPPVTTKERFFAQTSRVASPLARTISNKLLNSDPAVAIDPSKHKPVMTDLPYPTSHFLPFLKTVLRELPSASTNCLLPSF